MAEESLTPQVFTDSVKPLTDFLQEKFKDGIAVSDIKDELGRQYVDLVQEGGGVHGIALAGYTYILEKMNIGFMKMAGTSAGSINTLLLNAVYTKAEAEFLKEKGKLNTTVSYYETRSEKVLDYLAHKDLGELVDGHPVWRKHLLNLFSPLTGPPTVRRVLKTYKWLLYLGAISFLLLLLSAVALVFYSAPTDFLYYLKWITGISIISLILVITFFAGRIFSARLLYKYSEKFGINPGKNFEDWLDKILVENSVASVDDLNKKFTIEQNELKPRYKASRAQNLVVIKPAIETDETDLDFVLKRVRNPNVKIEALFDDLNQVINPDMGDHNKTKETNVDLIISAFEHRLEQDPVITREIVIVSSDITHEIKVEFPGMHKMYWGNNYGISPAKYVRASMSIPLFFKPFQVTFNQGQRLTIEEEWAKFLKVHKKVGECALFVDGGMLSNFPINVFYNPGMPVPRKPTFGLKLQYEEDSMSKDIKSLLSFFGSLISTMRFFYDRDFAIKHSMYQKTVRSIDTGNVHWLNFNLTSQEKMELFFRGALTATIFLAKHALTEQEVQMLIEKGKTVTYNNKTFSIYPSEDAVFKTEDCLVGNVTFEWQAYKKERLLDRITKDNKKDNMKMEAALKQVPKAGNTV